MKRDDREQALYFVTSFLGSVTLSYYLSRLMGSGTVSAGRMLLMLPVMVAGFWLFYVFGKRRPATLFMMNAAFAFLSLIALFLTFQFLSGLRGQAALKSPDAHDPCVWPCPFEGDWRHARPAPPLNVGGVRPAL
ncbi:hypothetical protein [Cystobacter fuscus]|uniref:hypothetical protein n=1 Tax=Cystobacter fuscus TaxID=43 RepID=UPI0005BD4304|nr:hypothetical protein [Cystobacter fuscus]